MSKLKKVGVLLIALFVGVLLISFLVGSAVNLIFPPSQAVYGDEIVEDIGGDNALVATLKDCVVTKSEDISDGNFKTSLGRNLDWKNAKNISYVDTFGRKGYMIVWKDSAQNYDFLSANNGTAYISDYLDSMDGLCFLVYFPEKDAVYGIILATDNIQYSESQLMYNILNLDKSDYSTTYPTSTYSSSGSSGGTSGHYHTTVPDRYSLSRSDPGAYYDHYEYGDNYAIDDYLESEGFD